MLWNRRNPILFYVFSSAAQEVLLNMKNTVIQLTNCTNTPSPRDPFQRATWIMEVEVLMLHFAFLQCSIFMPSYLLTLKCICFILLKILAFNGFALCTCPFCPLSYKNPILPMAQRDIFKLLINISEVLRQIVLTCGIDFSTSGNPTPGEVFDDVAV